MEPFSVAQEIVTSLLPLLPYLIKGGKIIAESALESAGQELGRQGMELPKKIWEKLWPKIKTKDAAREALQDVAEAPDDPEAQVVLRRQIQKLLEGDPSLTDELRVLITGQVNANNHSQILQGEFHQPIIATGTVYVNMGNPSTDNMVRDSLVTENPSDSTVNNFLDYVASRKRRVLSSIENDEGAFFRKYNPSIYVNRVDVEDKFSRFMKSPEKRCFVVTGEAGKGKSNLLCHLSSLFAYSGGVQIPLLMDGSSINVGEKPLMRHFEDELFVPHSLFRTLQDICARLKEQKGRLIIFIDAINEIRGEDAFQNFNRHFDNFIKYVERENLPIYFCISCRSEFWTQFSLHGSWARHQVFEPLGPELPSCELSGFLDENGEFERAKQLYFKQYGIGGDLSGNARTLCHDPLLLRIFCDASRPSESTGEGTAPSFVPSEIDHLRRKDILDRFVEEKRSAILMASTLAINDNRTSGFPEASREQVYRLTTRYLLYIAHEMYFQRRAYLTGDEVFKVAARLDHPDAKLGRNIFTSDKRSIFFHLLEEGILRRQTNDTYEFVFELYFEYSLGRYFALEDWAQVGEGNAEVTVEALSDKLLNLMKEHNLLISQHGFTNLFGALFFAVLVTEGAQAGSPEEDVYRKNRNVFFELLRTMSHAQNAGLMWVQQACALVRDAEIAQPVSHNGNTNLQNQKYLNRLLDLLSGLSKTSDFVIMWDLENTLEILSRVNFQLTLSHIEMWAVNGSGLQPIFATRALARLALSNVNEEPIQTIIDLLVRLAGLEKFRNDFWFARELVFASYKIVDYTRSGRIKKPSTQAIKDLIEMVSSFAYTSENRFIRGVALAALPFMDIFPAIPSLEVLSTYLANERWNWGIWDLASELQKWPDTWPDDDDAWIWKALERITVREDEHIRYAVDVTLNALYHRNPGQVSTIRSMLRGNRWLSHLRYGVCDDAHMDRLGVVYAPIFMEPAHDNHVECRERLQSILDLLQTAGVDSHGKRLYNWITPRLATEDDLRRVHSGNVDRHRDGSPWPDYISTVRIASEKALNSNDVRSRSGPSELRYESYDVALLSAGSVLTGIDYVMHENGARAAIALNRPPGHLANNTICLFNNVAIGARYAQEVHKNISKVMIVDCDAHQGKHTHYAFLRDPNVVYFSLHVQGNYSIEDGRMEHTGKDTGRGYTFNMPYPERIGDEGYKYIIDNLMVPLALEYKPDLILLSAGFDGHFDDPLTPPSLLTEESFIHLAEKLLEISKALDIKIVSSLEGGYGLEGLARSMVHMMAVLGGWPEDARKKIGFTPIPAGGLNILTEPVSIAHDLVRERVRLMKEDSLVVKNYCFDLDRPYWRSFLEEGQVGVGS